MTDSSSHCFHWLTKNVQRWLTFQAYINDPEELVKSLKMKLLQGLSEKDHNPNNKYHVHKCLRR